MNRELYKPISNAIAAFFLVILIKLAAMMTLKPSDVYSFVDIVLSFGVIIILLKFRIEFNRIITGKDAQTCVTGAVFALVIITLYITLMPYFDLMPYGVYHIIFFLLLLVPVYSLWSVINKNSDRLAEFFILSEKFTECSCGWKNPGSGRYCGGCGLPLPERLE